MRQSQKFLRNKENYAAIIIKYTMLSRTVVDDYVMCVSTGTPIIINFPFVPNGKLIISGVPKVRQKNIIVR